VPRPFRYALCRALAVARAPLLLVASLIVGCPGDDSTTKADVGGICTSIDACATGLVCLEGTCATEAPAASGCQDPASSAVPTPTIGTFSASQANYATCFTPIRTPSYSGPTPQHLGSSIAVGTSETFDVPAGTVSYSVLSQAATAVTTIQLDFHDGQGYQPYPNTVVPTNIRTPDGTLFFDDVTSYDGVGAADIHELQAYYGGVSPGSGAFTIPNTARGLDRLYTAGSLASGTWSLTVNDWAYECIVPGYSNCTGGTRSGQYDVTVLTKPGPLASTGTVNLALYLGGDLTASAALASSPFARYLTSLKQVMGRAGLCIGTVTLYDLPDWAKTRWATVDVDDPLPCGELSQLFTLAQPVDAVHLFLMPDLVSGSAPPGSSVVGVDGTIPGPSGVPGIVNSGAAVEIGNNLDSAAGCVAGTFDPGGCDPDLLAYITAHEAGHWLGLYHTTEAYGSLWDPLTDTGACHCDCTRSGSEWTKCRKMEAGGELLATDCTARSQWSSLSCAGGDNLMFWLFQQGASVGNLSPQQGRVVRLNPAVH
jgi:hypothetical protein